MTNRFNASLRPGMPVSLGMQPMSASGAVRLGNYNMKRHEAP